jgi:hypothetical protein
MTARRRIRNALAATDRVVAITLALTVLLCVYGITANRMHPDQMAFLPLFAPGKWPFDPGWFEKPPFYTYCNYFLAVLPLSLVAAVLHVPATVPTVAQIAWSRFLLACMFAGSVLVVFAVARNAYGVVAARIIAVVLATSAGMIAFVHQLTADIPVTWWMLIAFYFSDAILRDARPSNYVLAGLCTGLATATKYNGIGVGVAIVVAHLLRVAMDGGASRWRRLLFDRSLIVGLTMVPVGFLLGNPYAVLDYRTFKGDFLYNYMVAPVYEGQTGHSYGTFFMRIVEVVGAPAFVVFAVAAIVSTYLALRAERLRGSEATFWMTVAVCALYYAKFAPFPRLETRFVLPIVPFWLLLSGPCCARLRSYTVPLAALVAALVAYNVVCAVYVGSRFLADPRLAAERWIRANVPPGSALESDIYSSEVHDPGMRLRAVTTPFVTGRERLFQRVFPGNAFINGSDKTQRAAEERVAWYSVAELTRRDPDYVVIDSLYYDRFVQPGLRSELYPSMREYFDDLLAERYPYRIVFDRGSPRVPALIYPREIDFLDNRATILAKSPARTAPSPKNSSP